ncbi:MAG: hypothetical protein ACYCYI_00020 [Saccharofermentanales bacterium]
MERRNYKNIETILDLSGKYEWDEDGKIVIIRTNGGFDVNGFDFKTLKAAIDFIENISHVSVLSKGTKIGTDLAIVLQEEVRDW